MLDVLTEDGGTRPPGLSGQVALDATSFYWSDRSAIHRVAKAGANLGVDARETIVDVGSEAVFSVGANDLYWASEGWLRSVAKTAGAPPKTLAEVAVHQMAVDDHDVYVATDSGVQRVPLDGGPITTLDRDLACSSIALLDGDVYCRTSTSVFRIAKSGGPRTTLLDVRGMDLLLHDANVYADNFVGAFAEIVTVPTGGGMPKTIPVGSSRFGKLTAHDSALYFVDAESAVRRVPLDGAAPSKVDVSGFQNGGIAADASGVYWVDQRWTCLRTQVRPSTGRSDPGSFTCTKGLAELRVVHLPVVF